MAHQAGTSGKAWDGKVDREHTFVYGGQWVRLRDSEIEDSGEKRALRKRLEMWYTNKMSCFLPHGVRWHQRGMQYAGGAVKLPASQYPERWKNDGAAFLNDWEREYLMMVAPRKVGKSSIGAVKVGLYAMKCDPEWPIFQENGIEYREWDGNPKQVVIASFAPENMAQLWAVYQEFLPRYELGPYAPNWGMYPGEEGRQKFLNFGDSRPKSLELAVSKSKFIFLTYNQMQHVWENFKAGALHADEQIKWHLLLAWEDGARTMGDYTPAIFTLSGYCLEDRPMDTGAAGPLKVNLWDGKKADGRSVARYAMDVASTPDFIISPKKKLQLYDKYANPKIKRDDETRLRGIGTYYPGFQPGAGLAFDLKVWRKEIHEIPRLWDDTKTPTAMTKWRVIDYAPKKTTCVIWVAVGPLWLIARDTGRALNTGADRNMVVGILYRSLYETNILVSHAASMVIEMSHNTRRLVDRERDDETNTTYDVYEEVQSGEQFYRDLIDSRMSAHSVQGATIGELFERSGMVNLDMSSGARNTDQYSSLFDWLKIDPAAIHPWNKDHTGVPARGCPRLFFFSDAALEIVNEIETTPEEPVERKKLRRQSVGVIDERYPHDGLDCLKYLASDDPCWIGDDVDGGGKRQDEEYEDAREDLRAGTPFTGY